MASGMPATMRSLGVRIVAKVIRNWPPKSGAQRAQKWPPGHCSITECYNRAILMAPLGSAWSPGWSHTFEQKIQNFLWGFARPRGGDFGPRGCRSALPRPAAGPGLTGLRSMSGVGLGAERPMISVGSGSDLPVIEHYPVSHPDAPGRRGRRSIMQSKCSLLATRCSYHSLHFPFPV